MLSIVKGHGPGEINLKHRSGHLYVGRPINIKISVSFLSGSKSISTAPKTSKMKSASFFPALKKWLEQSQMAATTG